MKRQQQEVATRVYSYGTVPERVAPVRGEERALAQMRLGNRLWNVLAAIERTRIAAYRRIMQDETQERITALRERMAALRESVRLARQKERRRSADTAELTEQLAEAKKEIAGLIAEAKSTQQQRHDERREELVRLQERTKRRVKSARQAAASMGLYWGTYNDIMQRADAGRKHGGELHFRGFRGAGTVTAQVMNGASPEECISGSHTVFRIDPPQQGGRWRYARIRTGSQEDRSPEWLMLPVVYHREIPPEARIKSVSATRRIVAGKIRWQLNVTVTQPAAPGKPSGPAIGIDIGWRLRPDGVRVACWQDDRGRSGEVLVSSGDTGQFTRVASLRSICDRERDRFLPVLAAWLSAQELTEEWGLRSAHLSQWRSSDRLAALVRWWADHRLPDDDPMFAAALDWRRQYLHLANWWRSLSEQMTLRLREQYRCFAAQTVREYHTVYIEEFDLRGVARKPAAEGEPQLQGTLRQIVSPSLFRAALANACQREGVRVITVPSADTTRMCHKCGNLCHWDHSDLMHRCEHCGKTWDQDVNAAINILARGQEARTESQQDTPASGGDTEDRSQTAPETADVV